MTELVEKIGRQLCAQPVHCTDQELCGNCKSKARRALKATIEGLMEPSMRTKAAALGKTSPTGRRLIVPTWEAMLRAAAEENGIKLEPPG